VDASVSPSSGDDSSLLPGCGDECALDGFEEGLAYFAFDPRLRLPAVVACAEVGEVERELP
jgi:hypothetical protein|tara:strand:+ start:356 stop:538 length:183 start_codon:yes stop_codon:yes gene_type:complete